MATIELTLLRALSNKENLNKYISMLNTKTLSSESILLLKDYQQYFESRATVGNIDFDDFSTFFFIEKHPTLDEKSVDKYKNIISKIQEIDINDVPCSKIVAAFEQQELYQQLHNDLDKNVDINTVISKIDQFKQKFNSEAEDHKEESMDLIEALKVTDRSNGLRWRLKCLEDHFQGGLIKGDFGIIAGFVDSGKTSFLCSEITYMAEQLKGDQWIAWLNTEGSWQQIIPRIYCAALNHPIQDIRKWPDKAVDKYTKIMGGNVNRIKVMNFQGKSTKDVENLTKSNPPAIIIIDLLDHLRGFNKLVGSDGNATEKYGALYQWARELATNTCPVLAISQLNGDGNNEPYPSITNLRGSRVDKQGAATFQLIIGGLEGNSTERYLSMPKNKINSNKGWRCPVKFDPQRARFIG